MDEEKKPDVELAEHFEKETCLYQFEQLRLRESSLTKPERGLMEHLRWHIVEGDIRCNCWKPPNG